MATQWDKPGQGDKGDTGKQGDVGKQGGDIGKQGGDKGGGMPREGEKDFPEKKKEGDLPR